MAINFPVSLDALTNPAPTDYCDDVSLSGKIGDLNDAVEALEAKLGVDSSAVTTSIDYLLKSSSSSNPGHKHTAIGGITMAATDKLLGRVTAGAGAVEEVTFTDFAQTIVAAASAAATRALLGLDTGDSPQLTAINVGHATDTTLSRKSAGVLQVEANELYLQGGTDVAIGDGGTGASTAAAALANLGISYAKLTSDFTASATTTVANVTGLSFAVSNGLYYRFRFTLVVQADTSTTGIRVTITTPTFTILSALVYTCQSTDGTLGSFTGNITASGDEVTTGQVAAINTDYIMVIEGIILPSAGGTVQLQAACEVAAGVIKIRQASMVSVENLG